MSDQPTRPRLGVLAQYLALTLTWGLSFLFIKIALGSLSPAQVVLGRMLFGSLTLAVLLVVTRQRPPALSRAYAHLAVVGLTLCVVPFLLIAWAELRVPSGIASILNATTPLMTTLVTLAALRSERPSAAKVLGLLVGFAGVVIVFTPWTAAAQLAGGDLLAKAAILGATFCYGIGFVWLRRFVVPLGLPAIPVAFGQVGLGTLMLLLASPWLAGQPLQPTPAALAAVLPLGVLSTGLAYVWNTNLVAAWGPVPASTVTYLLPLVGVVAGAIALGEPVTAAAILGGVTIILGVVPSHGTLPLLLRRLTGRPDAPSRSAA